MVTVAILSSFLVGFLSVDAFIGFAEWADVLLDILHKVKYHTLLVITGMEADRAEFTYFCQSSIKG
jgi:hypothetical protein